MHLPLKIVGLTGGIASGKSIVAQILRKHGIPVIDADNLGHIALEPDGEAYAPVVKEFGKEILDSDGGVDRQKLGAKVFNNPKLRAKLEAITHPAIAALAKRGMEMIMKSGEPLAFYEAALLVETGTFKEFDALVVVSCSLPNQVKRLTTRNNLSPKAAAVRIASQYPLEEKTKVADWVIENNGTPEEIVDKVLTMLREIRIHLEIEQ